MTSSFSKYNITDTVSLRSPSLMDSRAIKGDDSLVRWKKNSEIPSVRRRRERQLAWRTRSEGRSAWSWWQVPKDESCWHQPRPRTRWTLSACSRSGRHPARWSRVSRRWRGRYSRGKETGPDRPRPRSAPADLSAVSPLCSPPLSSWWCISADFSGSRPRDLDTRPMFVITHRRWSWRASALSQAALAFDPSNSDLEFLEDEGEKVAR